ncbi:unnamed protein product [marine sediment metagenome]|uniref:ABC transporter domain-containing protein n=1 Tax=marine sediment metagenome TaxID=412755 RepID=X0TT70_9ZZZZ
MKVQDHDVVRDPLAAKAEIGLVPQEVALYEEVSARENLHFWGGACGLRGAELDDRIIAVLEHTGLLDRAREPVKRYSGGMKRRRRSWRRRMRSSWSRCRVRPRAFRRSSA